MSTQFDSFQEYFLLDPSMRVEEAPVALSPERQEVAAELTGMVALFALDREDELAA